MKWPKSFPFEVLPRAGWARQRPTHRDAEPAIMDAALKRSQRRPSGNWYAFAASSSVRANRPFGTSVAGTEIVAWRGDSGRLHVVQACARTWARTWPPEPSTAVR